MENNNFVYRNVYPEIIENLFPSYPNNGDRVEVDYGTNGNVKDTNIYVWFSNGNFVNKYGFVIDSVRGWRPYKSNIKD